MGCYESKNDDNTNKKLSNKLPFDTIETNRVVFTDIDFDEEVTDKLDSLESRFSKYTHKASSSTKKKKTDIYDVFDSRKIPTYIILTRKKLSIEVIESKSLDLSLKLTINPGGLEGSLRKAIDGSTFFGSKSKRQLSVNDINDFNFPDSEKLDIRHFEIKYNTQVDEYHIKCLSSSGLFLKIPKGEKVQLKKGMIINFINYYILVGINNEGSTTFQSDKEQNSTITLQIMSSDNILNEKVIFSSEKNKKYSIGRKNNKFNNDLTINNENVSRCQCSITYEYENWWLSDSDGLCETVNGTWFLPDEFYPLKENTFFRIGTSQFRCKIIKDMSKLETI